MSSEHNAAPPPPFRCSLQSSAGNKQLLSWEQEFNDRVTAAVKRTGAVLEDDITTQGTDHAFLVSNSTFLEDPVYLDFVLPVMSGLFNKNSPTSTATGLAPLPEPSACNTSLSLTRHSAADGRSSSYNLPHTTNIPITMQSVQIGDVGYIHKRTGEFVRLVNPYDMKNTAVGAMQRALGLNPKELRICRHPEHAWASSHTSCGDVAKVQLPAFSTTHLVANGIINTHAYVQSVLYMRKWLAWHVPLILGVYGPAHGLTRSDLVMVTSTVAARRWLVFNHSGAPSPAEAIVSVSGVGDDRQLKVELPAGAEAISVHSQPAPTADIVPEYTMSVSGLVFRHGVMLPEPFDVGRRSIDKAFIQAVNAIFEVREATSLAEEENQLDNLLRDIKRCRMPLTSTDELKRQIGILKDKVVVARQAPLGRYDMMREIGEIKLGWTGYIKELKAANDSTTDASSSTSTLASSTEVSTEASNMSASSRKSLSKLFKQPWNRWLRRKARTAEFPQETLN